ncbi:hypothetical protein M3I54_17250 [Paraburkholderia sp. CNPSo 3274]|uniref:hypothetical protein n=1 Tax=Paraburkholderia sp. CNPSo 3274 TaxID=2940932 RepID=UPI0020B6D01C|nr:hypothetical protein [Paraburkholderia sp. CNPSo 3274]MCP3708718.1 hypothetical protein [Paraburkholderia sp. CNPSo 3274]
MSTIANAVDAHFFRAKKLNANMLRSSYKFKGLSTLTRAHRLLTINAGLCSGLLHRSVDESDSDFSNAVYKARFVCIWGTFMSYRRWTSPAETAEWIILVGAAFSVLGGWIPWMGHAPYYFVAGVALIGAGILMLWNRSAGLWWYFGMFAAALIWSIFKVGLDGWSLLPRLFVLALIGIGISLVIITSNSAIGRPLRVAAIITAAIYVVAIASMLWSAIS